MSKSKDNLYKRIGEKVLDVNNAIYLKYLVNENFERIEATSKGNFKMFMQAWTIEALIDVANNASNDSLKFAGDFLIESDSRTSIDFVLDSIKNQYIDYIVLLMKPYPRPIYHQDLMMNIINGYVAPINSDFDHKYLEALDIALEDYSKRLRRVYSLREIIVEASNKKLTLDDTRANLIEYIEKSFKMEKEIEDNFCKEVDNLNMDEFYAIKNEETTEVLEAKKSVLEDYLYYNSRYNDDAYYKGGDMYVSIKNHDLLKKIIKKYKMNSKSLSWNVIEFIKNLHKDRGIDATIKNGCLFSEDERNDFHLCLFDQALRNHENILYLSSMDAELAIGEFTLKEICKFLETYQEGIDYNLLYFNLEW